MEKKPDILTITSTSTSELDSGIEKVTRELSAMVSKTESTISTSTSTSTSTQPDKVVSPPAEAPVTLTPQTEPVKKTETVTSSQAQFQQVQANLNVMNHVPTSIGMNNAIINTHFLAFSNDSIYPWLNICIQSI